MENGLGWPDYEVEGDAPAVRARARYKLWGQEAVKKIMLIDVAEVVPPWMNSWLS